MPFPTSKNTLLLFVGQQSPSQDTIKSYLATVHFEQIIQGMGNPNIGLMPRLEYVLKGAKKITSQLETTATDNPSYFTEVEAGVAEGSSKTGCSDAFGSSMSVLLWVSPVWRSRVSFGVDS